MYITYALIDMSDTFYNCCPLFYFVWFVLLVDVSNKKSWRLLCGRQSVGLLASG